MKLETHTKILDIGKDKVSEKIEQILFRLLQKDQVLHCLLFLGFPQSGKNIWKMKFFPGQGKVRDFCGWSGKFREDLESQGKVREFEYKWLWQADFRKSLYSVQEGKRCTFS